MSDLVKELRQVHDWRARRAADRIEMLERENNDMAVHFDGLVARIKKLEAALQSAGLLDIDVTVPDRDYFAMSQADCYEAGLMDAEFAFRNAVKAHACKALERENV